MGEIALAPREQFIEPSLGIRLNPADRNALAAQSRLGERNQKTLRCRSLRREIGQPPIDSLRGGQRKIGEAGHAEA